MGCCKSLLSIAILVEEQLSYPADTIFCLSKVGNVTICWNQSMRLHEVTNDSRNQRYHGQMTSRPKKRIDVFQQGGIAELPWRE